MPVASPEPLARAAATEIVFVPASKFFVRRIALAAGQDVGGQVELALETIGPFAPGQLYYGFHVSPGGDEALVFAAYRRAISAPDLEAWGRAEHVVPVFAGWLGQKRPTAPEVWLHENGSELTAILWDGRSAVPAGILARSLGDLPIGAVRDELTEEARRRLDAPTADVRSFTGEPTAGPLTKQGVTLVLDGREARFSVAQLRALDVRDKVELAMRSVRGRRDHRLWLGFAATMIVLGVCVVAELGVQTSRFLLGRERARQEKSAGEVRRIEEANQLVARMEQLAGQSLRPLEMLAVLNGLRPATLDFVRAVTVAGNARQLEVDASSSNPSDPQDYERALRSSELVEKVELSKLGTSGGRTTFTILVTFKPGFAGMGGAR